jgi:hypothetical protein
MIHELRIYRCVPGRKPALLSRFENETLRIWEKHGIRQAGFWTTLDRQEQRKRASEADAKLKRLYDAIENGVADLSDLMLKGRIAELKAIRDQARADAERADAAGRASRRRPSKRLPSRPASGCGPRAADIAATTSALAQRVEVDAKEVRIIGSKSVLLRTLVAAASAKAAGLAFPVLYRSGAPYGNRTRVSAVKGRRPGPLDEGRWERGHIDLRPVRQESDSLQKARRSNPTRLANTEIGGRLLPNLAHAPKRSPFPCIWH